MESCHGHFPAASAKAFPRPGSDVMPLPSAGAAQSAPIHMGGHRCCPQKQCTGTPSKLRQGQQELLPAAPWGFRAGLSGTSPSHSAEAAAALERMHQELADKIEACSNQGRSQSPNCFDSPSAPGHDPLRTALSAGERPLVAGSDPLVHEKQYYSLPSKVRRQIRRASHEGTRPSHHRVSQVDAWHADVVLHTEDGKDVQREGMSTVQLPPSSLTPSTNSPWDDDRCIFMKHPVDACSVREAWQQRRQRRMQRMMERTTAFIPKDERS